MRFLTQGPTDCKRGTRLLSGRTLLWAGKALSLSEIRWPGHQLQQLLVPRTQSQPRVAPSRQVSLVLGSHQESLFSIDLCLHFEHRNALYPKLQLLYNQSFCKDPGSCSIVKTFSPIFTFTHRVLQSSAISHTAVTHTPCLWLTPLRREGLRLPCSHNPATASPSIPYGPMRQAELTSWNGGHGAGRVTHAQEKSASCACSGGEAGGAWL